MFIKKSFVDEIANAMECQLVDGVINKQAETDVKIVKAAEYLHAAAEICDENGLSAQAEVITAILESLAAKKSKKKPKKTQKPVKSKKTPKSKIKKELTSEKMVNNLKEKGWVFDADDMDHNCADENCAVCGDSMLADDEEIYSMLKDFKKDLNSDFEDEDDFDLEIHNPYV